MSADLTTVAWRCAICGSESPTLLDPMVPPVPLRRVRICRTCGRVVCRRHSRRVGRGDLGCMECLGLSARE